MNGSHKMMFTTTDLAERWRMKPKTLENWRADGKGPAFRKLGGRVLYHIEDIVEYERAARVQSTSERGAA